MLRNSVSVNCLVPPRLLDLLGVLNPRNVLVAHRVLILSGVLNPPCILDPPAPRRALDPLRVMRPVSLVYLLIMLNNNHGDISSHVLRLDFSTFSKDCIINTLKQLDDQ